jgi:hypothetical protein
MQSRARGEKQRIPVNSNGNFPFLSKLPIKPHENTRNPHK